MNPDSFAKTSFYDFLRTISDKETVDVDEIMAIKGMMNKKEYDSLFGQDRDNLKNFFVTIMSKDYRILDEIYDKCKHIEQKGLIKKDPLDMVKNMPILSDKTTCLNLVAINGYSIGYFPNKLGRDLDVIKASRESFSKIGVNITKEDIQLYDMFDNKASIYRYFYRSRLDYPHPTFLFDFDLHQKVKTTIFEFLDYLINYKVLYNKDMAFNLWGVTTQSIVENSPANNFVLCNSTICGIPLVSFVSFLIGDKDTQYVFKLHQAPGIPIKLTKKEETIVKHFIEELIHRHEIFMGIIDKIYSRIEDHRLPSDFVPSSHNLLMLIADADRQGEKEFLTALMDLYGRIYNFSAVVMDERLLSIQDLNRIRNELGM